MLDEYGRIYFIAHAVVLGVYLMSAAAVLIRLKFKLRLFEILYVVLCTTSFLAKTMTLFIKLVLPDDSTAIGWVVISDISSEFLL